MAAKEEMPTPVLKEGAPLGVGEIVHYVLPAGRGRGEHRPALVVRGGLYPGLYVFLDGANDDGADPTYMPTTPNDPHSLGMHLPRVMRDDSAQPGTWHWPEKV